jgi:biotin carboxyl carrier protein
MKQFKIRVNGKEFLVEVEEIEKDKPSANTHLSNTVETKQMIKDSDPKTNSIQRVDAVDISEGEEIITAPMPGKILKINVTEGDNVAEGDTLVILEAMKMENEIVAGSNGKVKRISVIVNQMVDTDDVLVVIG